MASRRATGSRGGRSSLAARSRCCRSTTPPRPCTTRASCPRWRPMSCASASCSAAQPSRPRRSRPPRRPRRRSQAMSSSSAFSELETAALAAALARDLPRGAVVYVEGELGAGKTAFVRGAARALGVTGAVTSPTFTVAHLYDGADGAVAHLDLSRSERVDDAAWGDL